MYLVRDMLGMSYPEMGRFFCKDHTTVMSAVRKVEADPSLIAKTKDALAEKTPPKRNDGLPAIGTTVRKVGRRPSSWRAEVRGIVDGCLVLRRWSAKKSSWDYLLEARDAWDFGELQEIVE